MQECPMPATLERAFLCPDDIARNPAMHGEKQAAGTKVMEITQPISHTLRNKWKE